MKIAFVVNRSSAHGGSFKMMAWLANQLAKTNDVFYCNLSNDEPFFKLDENIEYIKLNCIRKSNFIYRNTVGFLKSVKEIVKLQKHNKFDLFISFSDHSFYALILAKLFVKMQVVVSQRVDPNSTKKLTDKIRMSLYYFCSGLVCQTKSALDFFSPRLIKKTKGIVIYNPAIRKAEKYWNVNDDHNYILSLGRIEFKQKRQDVLLDAFKLVIEKYPKEKLYIYGASNRNSDKKLIEMIKERKLENNVEYKGTTDKPLEVLYKAKMLVLSSDYEGIPNCLLEGMDVGVPIITTDCKPGGAKLLIDTEDKGIVVDRGDYKRLAEAIIYYIEHLDISSYYAQNAQKSLSRFSEKIIINEWEKYLQGIGY